MKLHILSLCVFACTTCAFDIDDVLDRLDNTLTISAFHDNLRARLSGTVDLEFYNLQKPPPGLIDSNIRIPNLFFLTDAARPGVRSNRSRRRHSSGRVCGSSYAMAGRPIYLPNGQIRNGGRQLGAAALVMGESVYQRAISV